MVKIDKLKIREIHQGLLQKEFSAEELTSSFIDRIKNLDPQINSYLACNFEDAISTARKVDRLISRGEVLPRLAGIPAGVKDVIITKSIVTTAGSKILEDFQPPYDATVVARLRENYSPILGKNNCDEFAMGSSTENSAFKKTINPKDHARVPGGSSGGSAAAVAADLAVYALASDTGGSIRQPAALCGVVGLKPTYGRVSRFGLIAMASSLDQIGPIASCVEDAAEVLSEISGPDIYDATSEERKSEDFARLFGSEIKGKKIGVVKEFFEEGLEPASKEKIEHATGLLADIGADVVEVSLPATKYALAAYYILMPAEVSANLARFDGIRFGKDRQFFGEEAKRRIILGTFVLSSGYQDQYYKKANKARVLLKDEFDEALKNVDYLVGPTSPTVAWKLGEKTDDPLSMYLSDIYTVSVNLTGNPAISIPCGLVGGLPVGFQIIGRHFDEAGLLQAAYKLEEALR